MDLIDREQAVATIDELNAISFYEANEHSREAYKEIRMAIEHLPSAENTGRWVMFDNNYFCSNCNEQHDYRTYYCPNCGAKMEG